MIKKCFIVLVILVLPVLVFSQQADKITDIIESDLFTCGQAAYICSTFLDENTESFSYEQAMNWVIEKNLLKTDKDFSMPITVAEFSGLCMKTWNIPGGLFYKLTNSNRYAYKEMRALGFVSIFDDPSKNINGASALNVIYKCMELGR